MQRIGVRTLFLSSRLCRRGDIGQIRGFVTSSGLRSTSHSTDLDISRGIKPSYRRRSEFDGPSYHDSLESPLRQGRDYRLRNKVVTYSPPGDLEQIIENIVTEEYGETDDFRTVSLDDNFLKSRILLRLNEALKHSVPNSHLWEMKTVENVVDFYAKGVNNSTAFENLPKLDLPPNLSIRTDYVRFDPETDTFFGGVTAFPKSDTIISGVKPKKLYKTVRAKKEPYEYLKF